MAGGSLQPLGVAQERAKLYEGRLTTFVLLACMVAAIGGSIFGYDIGISGEFMHPIAIAIANCVAKLGAHSVAS